MFASRSQVVPCHFATPRQLSCLFSGRFLLAILPYSPDLWRAPLFVVPLSNLPSLPRSSAFLDEQFVVSDSLPWPRPSSRAGSADQLQEKSGYILICWCSLWCDPCVVEDPKHEKLFDLVAVLSLSSIGGCPDFTVVLLLVCIAICGAWCRHVVSSWLIFNQLNWPHVGASKVAQTP